jgi:5-dehydro-2-deoxygluconokinase
VLRADTEARVLSRLYELGIRPDWWVLEPQPRDMTWESCARVIGASDPDCRGVLVALGTGGGQQAALLATAAASPIVRGFIAGGSIFEGVADVAQMAERFRALVDAWIAARDPRYDQQEGSRR